MARSVRNIEIAGRRTSFKLENQFWGAVQRCAAEKNLTVNQLITHAVRDHRAPKATMSSAVRVYVIEYFRDRVIAQERTRRAA